MIPHSSLKSKLRDILKKYGKIRHINLNLFSDRECINEIHLIYMKEIREWMAIANGYEKAIEGYKNLLSIYKGKEAEHVS